MISKKEGKVFDLFAYAKLCDMTVAGASPVNRVYQVSAPFQVPPHPNLSHVALSLSPTGVCPELWLS
jgi:hypothetical protein